MGHIQVFKLQRPLVTNDPNAGVLAYNKRRTEEYNVQLSDAELKQIFPEGVYKVYYLCKDNDGTFEIGERVVDREW